MQSALPLDLVCITRPIACCTHKIFHPLQYVACLVVVHSMHCHFILHVMTPLAMYLMTCVLCSKCMMKTICPRGRDNCGNRRAPQQTRAEQMPQPALVKGAATWPLAVKPTNVNGVLRMIGRDSLHCACMQGSVCSIAITMSWYKL